MLCLYLLYLILILSLNNPLWGREHTLGRYLFLEKHLTYLG
jgi:hypothetical protein